MKKRTNCQDWHRGWGFGNNHIGTLHKTDIAGKYVWTGRQQGRWGNQWNRGMRIEFLYHPNDSSKYTITMRKNSYDSLPDFRDVEEAIKELENVN